ncbi:MAG: hypothetical protein ACMUJM_07020 [bacterium]
MDKDAIVGTIIIGVGLAFITYLTFWSRRVIDRIADKNLRGVRKILKDIHGD